MKSNLTFILAAMALLITTCTTTNSSPEDSATKSRVQDISILKLDSLQAALPKAILIDVRSDEEWAAGHLQGASYISFDWDNRLDSLKILPQNQPILIYCEAGGRSGVVTEELRILGHPNVVNLIGGMEMWAENDLPVAFHSPIPLLQYDTAGSSRKPISDTPGRGVSRIP